MNMPELEIVKLPCETCQRPLTVNKVYEPYLNGKVRCRTVDCPYKPDKF